MITDWHFYAAAIPGTILLGLGKGGFSGIGMLALPLLALVMPPLQAAAILLPIPGVRRPQFTGMNDPLASLAYLFEWR